MEVPRLGVKSELQLPAYTTATAALDLSLICDLSRSFRQRRILDPLNEAIVWTCNLMDTGWLRNPLSHNGNSTLSIFSLAIGKKDIGAPVALSGVFSVRLGSRVCLSYLGQGSRRTDLRVAWGAPVWCSGLRIQLCHCRHLALIPGSGASTFFWQKELTHTEQVISLQIEEFLLTFANLPLYFKKHVVRISFSFFLCTYTRAQGGLVSGPTADPKTWGGWGPAAQFSHPRGPHLWTRVTLDRKHSGTAVRAWFHEQLRNPKMLRTCCAFAEDKRSLWMHMLEPVSFKGQQCVCRCAYVCVCIYILNLSLNKNTSTQLFATRGPFRRRGGGGRGRGGQVHERQPLTRVTWIWGLHSAVSVMFPTSDDCHSSEL